MTELKKFLDLIYPIHENTWGILKVLFKDERLKKGDFFIHEGEIATRFAFLQDGVVRAFYTNGEGKDYTKHFFTAGSIIGGYSSLITGKPSLFSQQALTNCKVLSINYNQLLSLYDAYPDLERLARKFAENYFVSNEAKEAKIVLNNADVRYLEFRNIYPGLEQIIPQYHIASYLGVSPTQLSRIRKKMT
ncbi:MAG: Crp/Fnr family transcriptional regulator [Sphingobacteriales bacterium]|nr:Crp/Fnr family transcriptional regulator [Sphingobacteriales bacterium]